MFTFLLTLLLLDGLILSVAVLRQAGQGGGLASLGGDTSSQILGGRQANEFLTKTTWITGAIFMTLSLVLSIMSGRQGGSNAVQENLRRAAAAEAAQQRTAPPAGGSVDELLNASGGAGAGQTSPVTGTPPSPQGNQP